MRGKFIRCAVLAATMVAMLCAAAPAWGQDLAVPENLQLEVDGSSITATWNPVFGADEYQVQLKLGDSTQSSIVAATSYTFEFLTPGTEYRVRVRARAAGSANSQYSAVEKATALINDVMNLQLAPGHEELVATWDPVSSATGYDVEYWKSSDEAELAEPGSGYDWDIEPESRLFLIVDGASYTISDLINGTEYSVRVAARYVDEGESGSSDDIYVYGEYSGIETGTPVPSMLAAPMNVQVTSGFEQLVVAWDAVMDAQDYVVDLAGGGDSVSRETTDTIYTFMGLTNGTQYTIEIQARADSGNVTSPASDAVTARPGTPLAKVTGLRLYSQDEGISVDWNEVADAEQYEIQVWTSPSSRTPYIATFKPRPIGSLDNGTEYQVRVRALADGGVTYGEWSNTKSVTPGCPDMTQVEQLVLKQRRGRLVASWKRVPGCTVFYDVQYRPVETTDWMSVSESQSSPKLTIRGLTNGLGYDVRVRAVQPLADGFDRGPWSYVKTATPRDWRVRLTAPVITSATAGRERITIRWEPIGSAEYYWVAYTPMIGNREGRVTTTIEGVDANAYTIIGLNAGTTYKVRVLGMRAFGTAPGPWSQAEYLTPTG